MCGGARAPAVPAGPTAAELAETARVEQAKVQAQIDATNRANLLKKKAQAELEGGRRAGGRSFLQAAAAGLQEEQPTSLVARV